MTGAAVPSPCCFQAGLPPGLRLTTVLLGEVSFRGTERPRGSRGELHGGCDAFSSSYLACAAAMPRTSREHVSQETATWKEKAGRLGKARAGPRVSRCPLRALTPDQALVSVRHPASYTLSSLSHDQAPSRLHHWGLRIPEWGRPVLGQEGGAVELTGETLPGAWEPSVPAGTQRGRRPA